MAVDALKQPHYNMSVEMNNAELLYQNTPTKQDIETQKNGLHIENSPVRLEIDNRAFFDSLGLKSIGTYSRELVQKGKQAVLEATKKATDEGNMMMGPHGLTPAKIAQMHTQETLQALVEVVPLEKPEMNWTEGNLNIEYVPDKLDIRWDIGGINFKYIPYQLSIQFLPQNG